MDMAISNILYASDLGDSSRHAFQMAVLEAVKHDARIIFLNIVEPPSHSAETILNNLSDKESNQEMLDLGLKNIQKLIEQRIEKLCIETLGKSNPLKYKPVPRIEEGHAAETIIAVADEVNADLIVMGSRSRTHTTLKRFFVGSTAQNVIQLSNTPVLIIPIPTDS